MIDESLLDAPEALTRADPRGLLRAVAASGAQVRTALGAAAESGIARLRPEGRPGTVLLAGPGPDVPLAADLLRALGDDAVRITRLAPVGPVADPGALRWALPRWAGPLDLLVLTTVDGSEPGLGDLLEHAYRRGCSIVAVAPAGSSLAGLTARRRSLAIPLTAAPHVEPADHPAAPGPAWSLLTPVLLLADRLGLCTAGTGELTALADRLDAVADRNGPVAHTEDSPAKVLAVDFDGALPLLWSEGPIARAAARHAAATFAGLAAVPSLAAELPEALAAHGALLGVDLLRTTAPGPDDIFRDRVDEPLPLRARVLLLRDHAADAAGPADSGRPPEPSAVPAARELAREQGTAVGELAPADGGGPLEAAGELLAQLDFTAVYLALTAPVRT